MRWRLACDRCAVAAWVGPGPRGALGWCEACQAGAPLAGSGRTPAPCPRCARPLTLGAPRFVEIHGQLQHLAAVLDAWLGHPAPLAALLPRRPVYLTDLAPPDPDPADPPRLAAALAALAAGRFAEAAAALESTAGGGAGEAWAARARARLVRAIVAHRGGDVALAEAEYTGVLEQRPDDARARLNRGALRAARGDHQGARADLAGAGGGHEARWNHAASLVLEALERGAGVPDAATLAAARALAGPPSSYWSDHTIGRLLWASLIEGALGAGSTAGAGAARGGGSGAPDRSDPGLRAPRGVDAELRLLHAAEAELESDTFWDLGLVIHGYAALGALDDASRVAGPLACGLLDALAAEPAMNGAAGEPFAAALAAMGAALARSDATGARAALGGLQARNDLARYRVPCLHCRTGSIGVVEVEQDEVEGDEIA